MTPWACGTIISYASVAKPYLIAVFRKDIRLKLVVSLCQAKYFAAE